jgi:Zn-dependent peptidase ImmA (M78 family)
MKYIEEKTEQLLMSLNAMRLPIDPKKCAERYDVVVNGVSLEDNVSGLFMTKDSISYIVYNSDEVRQRQRFTIAHEFGHFMLHKNVKLFIDRASKVLYRNSASTTGDSLKEREANAFAASLLMPKILIEEEINKAPKNVDIVDYLADRFDVSSLAMSIRLSNLGYEIGW